MSKSSKRSRERKRAAGVVGEEGEEKTAKRTRCESNDGKLYSSGDREDGKKSDDWENLSRSQKRNKLRKMKLKENKRDSKGAAVSPSTDDRSDVLKEATNVNVSTAECDNEKEEEEEISYPYEVDSSDHCETPLVAYEHICRILDAIAKQLGKSRASLRIYDPYYCEGGMREKLDSLGFKSVTNEKRDFYADFNNSLLPEYDVLVTNPPYSGDHVPKLLTMASSSGKPFFLLMPNYFYMKDYYYPCLHPVLDNSSGTGEELRRAVQQATVETVTAPAGSRSHALSLFFISPEQRYSYHTPKGRRQAKSSKFTSPFPSFWYCHLGGGHHTKNMNERKECTSTLSTSFLQKLYNKDKIDFSKSNGSKVHFSDTIANLPLAVLPDNDVRKKAEKNDRKRQKHKARKLKQSGQSNGNTTASISL